MFTTLGISEWSTQEILDLYRTRWQIELSFKRLKSLLQFGHLPKYNADSCKAWFYGKLLVAMLIEKSLRMAQFFPPGDTKDTNKNKLEQKSNKKQTKSLRSFWREYCFMLHVIQQAIMPSLTLIETQKNWHIIQKLLRDPPRKRRRYEVCLFLG